MNEHKLTSYKCDEHGYNDRWKIALFKPFLLRSCYIRTKVGTVSFHKALNKYLWSERMNTWSMNELYKENYNPVGENKNIGMGKIFLKVRICWHIPEVV